MENKKRRWPLIVFIIFIIVTAALYVYLYLMPEVGESMTETATVEKGTVIRHSTQTAIVVREENVVYSDVSGNISFYAEEGEKTRVNSLVADVYTSGEKHPLYCSSTGIISYYLDGYEDIFTPETLGKINIEDYLDFDVKPADDGKSSIENGQAAYKLITSNTWYFMLIIDKQDKALYPINGSLKICLEDGSIIPASVLRYIGLGDKLAVVASTKTYYADFAKLRTISVDVIYKEMEGYLVPAAAVCEKDGVSGIYVLGVDEEYYFKEIEILCEDGDNTLISSDGNIRLYDEILRTGKEE